MLRARDDARRGIRPELGMRERRIIPVAFDDECTIDTAIPEFDVPPEDRAAGPLRVDRVRDDRRVRTARQHAVGPVEDEAAHSDDRTPARTVTAEQSSP